MLSGTRIAADKDLEEGLDEDSPIYKAIMSNHVVQLGLNNPRSLLGMCSISGLSCEYLNEVEPFTVKRITNYESKYCTNSKC